MLKTRGGIAEIEECLGRRELARRPSGLRVLSYICFYLLCNLFAAICISAILGVLQNTIIVGDRIACLRTKRLPFNERQQSAVYTDNRSQIEYIQNNRFERI